MSFDVTKQLAETNITLKRVDWGITNVIKSVDGLATEIKNYSSSTDQQATRMKRLTWALVFVGAVQAVATVVQVILQFCKNV